MRTVLTAMDKLPTVADVEDDPKYPGSTACQAEGCDCIAYEAGEDDGD